MELFICQRCQVLLLQVDIKYNDYRRSEINDNGEYEWLDDDHEIDIDYTLCPICSGTDSIDHDKTLKVVNLPKDLKTPLFNIWYPLTQRKANLPVAIQVVVEYGIPLNNKKLKRLLVEHLI